MYLRVSHGRRKCEQLEAVSSPTDTPGPKCCNIHQGEAVGIYYNYNVIYYIGYFSYSCDNGSLCMHIIYI